MSADGAATAPTAVLISIGEELLEGRTQDTNARTFAAALLRMGFHVIAMHTVGDAPGALQTLLCSLRGQADILLTTGGLGPTEDDRVREEVAAALGVECKPIPVPGAVPFLREVYARFHPGEPPAFFLEQATMPEGAEALANAVGTAWGFMTPFGKRSRLYVLPGPPRECAATFFEGGAAEDLKCRFSLQTPRLAYALLHTTGAAESLIEEPIREFLQAGANPRVGITAAVGGVSLSLLARPHSEGRSAQEVLEECVQQMRARLAPFCWGRDEETLAGVVVEGLLAAKQTFCCAESCTGGLLAAAMTEVPGASRVFTHGWVSYANVAKTEQLGVPHALLEEQGAVSEAVALAMAEGARRKSGSDWAISITGLAGPGGGSAEKPVGTVFMALVGPNTSLVQHRHQYARGGRSFVRGQTVAHALDMLRRALAGLPLEL